VLQLFTRDIKFVNDELYVACEKLQQLQGLMAYAFSWWSRPTPHQAK